MFSTAILLLSSLSTPALASAGYPVGARDVLQIQVYDEPDLSGAVEVDDAGFINAPLLGRMSISGMTPEQISDALEDSYGDRYLVNPQVTVRVETYASKPVQVFGAVASPGVFHLTGTTTLMDVLAEAGGVQTEGGVLEIQIQRGGASGQAIDVNVDALMSSGEGNLYLEAGDVIYVPEGRVVYVSGEVNKSGAVPYAEGLRVTQALTAAGGAAATASLRRVYVLRDDTRLPVNIKRILQGKDPDFQMEPNDQLFVNRSIF